MLEYDYISPPVITRKKSQKRKKINVYFTFHVRTNKNK
jgi:hypothetical protein